MQVRYRGTHRDRCVFVLIGTPVRVLPAGECEENVGIAAIGARVYGRTDYSQIRRELLRSGLWILWKGCKGILTEL